MGFKIGTFVLIPGELHCGAVPGFRMETFTFPQRRRVGLEMLALHTADQCHKTSLTLVNSGQLRKAGRESSLAPAWFLLFF